MSGIKCWKKNLYNVILNRKAFILIDKPITLVERNVSKKCVKKKKWCQIYEELEKSNHYFQTSLYASQQVQLQPKIQQNNNIVDEQRTDYSKTK